MDPNPPEPAAQRVDRRLDRLEELVSFAEQRHEELNSALLDLAARLEHIAARVERMGSTIESLAHQAAPDTDDPIATNPPGDPPAGPHADSSIEGA